ncbi:hypothetical protein [Spiroplasma alleghenense]|uniref:Transmembrane protein n=1 Tax=Spiroplasma alleghenense TaxID=216931 RepID=A0A345Z357_9MOLU|nr:hypothetical protein [Spiroplasma alleghenense]AXK51036.1 hypothetical protein SALLE_v1c03620 [Spiroplasma alleghenense]
MSKNKIKLLLKIGTAVALIMYLLIVLVFIPVLIKNEDKSSFVVFLYGYLFLTIVPYSVIGPLFLWDYQVEKRNYNQAFIFSIVIICTQLILIGMLSYSISQFQIWKQTDYANRNHLIIESLLLFVSIILVIIACMSLIFNPKPKEIDTWDSIVIEIEKRSRLSIKSAKNDLQDFKSNLK